MGTDSYTYEGLFRAHGTVKEAPGLQLRAIQVSERSIFTSARGKGTLQIMRIEQATNIVNHREVLKPT